MATQWRARGGGHAVRVIIVAQHIGEESNDPRWFVGYSENYPETGLEEIQWRSPPSGLRDKVVGVSGGNVTARLLVIRA